MRIPEISTKERSCGFRPAASLATQSALQRKHKFDAARPRAHKCDAALGPLRDTRPQRLEMMQKPVNRLDRNRVFGRAGHKRRIRRRAGIDRHDVVRRRRAVVADDAPGRDIDPDRRALIEAGTGEPRQRAGIDMSVVEAVGPGDQAGQHAGIGRMDLAGDEGETDAGHWFHAEASQHLHMGVSGPDQYHILDDRPGHGLHGYPFQGQDRGVSASRLRKHYRWKSLLDMNMR